MTVDMNVVMQTLTLMGQGMLGIFVVIGLIFLTVVLLTKFTGKKKEEASEE